MQIVTISLNVTGIEIVAELSICNILWYTPLHWSLIRIAKVLGKPYNKKFCLNAGIAQKGGVKALPKLFGAKFFTCLYLGIIQ